MFSLSLGIRQGLGWVPLALGDGPGRGIHENCRRTARRPGSQRIRQEVAHSRLRKCSPGRKCCEPGRLAVQRKPAPTT